MLRTNLATRPFYNERAVHLFLGALALVAVALMVWTATEVVALSRVHGDLTLRAEEAEELADEVLRRASGIRRDLNQDELERLAAAAAEANRLIDQRVFSWTQFFNRIERTLPAGVMLTSVRPAVRPEGVEVAMGVVARGIDDIDEFIEELERTGAFASVLSRQEEITDQGTYRAVLRGQYLPGVEEPAAEPEVDEPRAERPADPVGATPVERGAQP